MKTRIRYTETNGMLTSSVMSTTMNDVLTVTLLPSELKYTVASSTRVIAEGTGTSLVDLKKQAKKALRDNGASFLSELRKKKMVSLDADIVDGPAVDEVA